MPIIPRLWDLTGGALLWRAGLAGRLTTPGRRSGTLRTVQCGYLDRPNGSILVGSVQGRQWPENLAAAGWCTFEARRLPPRRYTAEELQGADRAAATAEFLERRGERAARMFSDRVFVLRPDDSTT
jgi:deazaflavin-dependent oxidoreductase (nitroreductase family)